MNIGDYLTGKLRSSGFITRFFLAYFLALFVMAVFANIFPDMAILIYFVCGFSLNRYILSKMRWHVIQATLSRIAMAKILALILWPVVYPVLLMQLLIARIF